MKTEEGNKLITEFMGCASQLHLTEHPFTGEYTDPDEFKYHSSWDWLMPVVEKIDAILADDDFVTISYNRCLIDVYAPSWIFPDKELDSLSFGGLGDTRIKATWNCVVEFIQWYNEQ